MTTFDIEEMMFLIVMFSACILKNGNYETWLGSYFLKPDVLAFTPASLGILKV